jgi:aryl-alcohol dehydrogenase-like predicted oxidoreductase
MGMGCWAIGGVWTWVGVEEPFAAGWGKVDDADSIKAIHAGIDAGVTFFDTAANYGAGHSERILGQALAGRRDKVVIATKFGHIINEAERTVYGEDDKIVDNVRQDCENSLRRLGTDYIDVYQLHAGDYDPDKALLVRDILEELVKDGKIRAYGWSTDLPDRAKIFAEGENCAAIQFALNVFQDNLEVREICKEYDLAGINKSPFSRGLLTGKFSEETTFQEDDIRHGWSFKSGKGAYRLRQLNDLRDILTANGHTLAQASLAYIWALDDRMIPIPGFKSVKQVEENAGAMNLGPLKEDQMSEIDQILGRGTEG